MDKPYQYLFGPVPSRRLGLSLGVDLTPHKTCCLDCVFCQLGKTTHKTVVRKEYVPTEAVLREIKQWLATDVQADVITLSGSGEPTLHTGFGDILAFVRESTDIPTVLLTNGALLHLPEIRDAASAASVVKVSLSAWDQASFEWVNRPSPQLRFDQLVAGQKAFRDQFTGRLLMEVFLIAGMNALPEDVRKIASLAEDIGPDRIQLNTAVRPPSEDYVAPLSRERMSALTHLFHPEAEIIAEFNPDRQAGVQANQEAIFAMLRRRPCTTRQISEGFGMHLNEVLKYVGKLIRDGRIRAECKEADVYYVTNECPPTKVYERH
jgi:wyosine [tRNA(Phe)-imidazoG37] synthetase (radical SAM superfamily)